MKRSNRKPYKPADKIEPRQDELTEFEKAVKQVMEEAIECGDIHNLKADADMLLRLVQKPWSEEDERTYKSITYSFAHNYPLTIQQQEFVKYLKDRVQPQPKQEWSEEDEKVLHAIRNALNYEKPRNYLKSRDFEFTDILDWLKSLKERYTWKPSDLQMECLSDAIKHYNSQGYTAPILKELLDALKKLKE